jgi:hypothetical protein
MMLSVLSVGFLFWALMLRMAAIRHRTDVAPSQVLRQPGWTFRPLWLGRKNLDSYGFKMIVWSRVMYLATAACLILGIIFHRKPY